MFIYALALGALALVWSVYLGEPLSALYVHQPSQSSLSLPFLTLELPLELELEVALGAGLGLALVALGRLLSRRVELLQRMDRDFAVLFASAHPLYLTGLAFMSAFAEEVIFRGWLLPMMGLWWSSALFGAAHVPMERHHWPWPLAATLMGLLWGGLTALMGSVTVAFVAHFTLNHFNLHALRSLELESRPPTRSTMD